MLALWPTQRCSHRQKGGIATALICLANVGNGKDQEMKEGTMLNCPSPTRLASRIVREAFPQVESCSRSQPETFIHQPLSAEIHYSSFNSQQAKQQGLVHDLQV
jgi:hypothetical protein